MREAVNTRVCLSELLWTTFILLWTTTRTSKMPCVMEARTQVQWTAREVWTLSEPWAVQAVAPRPSLIQIHHNRIQHLNNKSHFKHRQPTLMFCRTQNFVTSTTTTTLSQVFNRIRRIKQTTTKTMLKRKSMIMMIFSKNREITTSSKQSNYPNLGLRKQSYRSVVFVMCFFFNFLNEH